MEADFDRQVQTLLDRGYPELLGLDAAALRAACEPLRADAAAAVATDPDRVPFVIVARPGPAAIGAMVERTALGTKAGFVDFKPGGLEAFAPLADLAMPGAPVYLLRDVDTGTATLDVTPDDALPRILADGRSPLTIEEGVALVTQRPDKLRKNRCFSLLGSRSGDKRVPALWISQGRPKLGWCWAGNPHTWLGSASCGDRRGP